MSRSRIIGLVSLIVGIVLKFVFYEKDAELLSTYNIITGALVGGGIALLLVGNGSKK